MCQPYWSTSELFHQLHTTSCEDTPLIHARQQILSTAPWTTPTTAWERYFSNWWCHITVHEHTTPERHRACIANTLPPGAPSRHTIGVLLERNLKNNNLSFIDRHFVQLVGTAMGTKAAPPYANFFMDCHEETIREAFICAIPFWKRFIDDIFMIFLGTTKQLQSMKDFMNNLQPTIKFTFKHSTQEISFPDTAIHIGADRKLSTTLYRKTTDCAALLHFHFNHSLKCKQSIVFSQALRYKLLIADHNKLQKELDSLTTSLLARKYPWEIITRNISKALLHSRDTLLYRTPNAWSSRSVPQVGTPDSSEGRQISKSVRDH